MAKAFRLTPPKPFIPKELDDQIAVFEYATIAAKSDPRWKLLFATLNGVRLPIGLAVKAKRAGNKAGVPDYILPVVNSQWPGLWIEGKRIKGGVLSEAQKWWRDRLREQGYKWDRCDGPQAVIETVKTYLAIQ